MIPAGKKCVHTPKTAPTRSTKASSGHPHFRENPVIILGILLLVLGYVLPLPLLYTIGWILVVIGVILWIVGAIGHPVAGRRYWW